MKNRTRYLLLLLLAVLDTHVKAQWNFDIPVVEAYINDHKQQRSLLLARSTLELSNQLLHEYSSDAAVGYKELNIDFANLDKPFDQNLPKNYRNAMTYHIGAQYAMTDRLDLRAELAAVEAAEGQAVVERDQPAVVPPDRVGLVVARGLGRPAALPVVRPAAGSHRPYLPPCQRLPTLSSSTC